MLQDIAPQVYHNEFFIKSPKAQDYFFYIRDGKSYLNTGEGSFPFASFGEFSAKHPEICEHADFLFSISGQDFYLLDERNVQLEEANGYAFAPPAVFRTLQPAWSGFAGITGIQLHRFYRNRIYCGHCGHKMEKKQDERALRCPVCRTVEYPKISPGIIVAVTDGDRILMTKYAGRANPHFALIAGFTEIGETLEETVHREVMEEVGLKVRNLRYYKNQPWSFSDSLLVGFFAKLDGSPEIHRDDHELATAEWYTRAEMPHHTLDISLTHEMIEVFRQGKQPEAN